MSESEVKVVVHTPDGREEYGVEEYIKQGGSVATVRLLAKEQAKLDAGTLPDDVDHNDSVVERAMEEDVFVGEAKFKGWLVNDSDNAVDAWGKHHPGATISGRFLMESYSDDAWRLIAEESGGRSGRWYNYRWVFLPKSEARVTRVEGVEGRKHAEEIGRRAREEDRKRRDDSWVENESEVIRSEREMEKKINGDDHQPNR